MLISVTRGQALVISEACKNSTLVEFPDGFRQCVDQLKEWAHTSESDQSHRTFDFSNLHCAQILRAILSCTVMMDAPE